MFEKTISSANAKIATDAVIVPMRDACLVSLLAPSFEPTRGKITARKNAAKPNGNRISSMPKPLWWRIYGQLCFRECRDSADYTPWPIVLVCP